jgi:cell division protein FtsL
MKPTITIICIIIITLEFYILFLKTELTTQGIELYELKKETTEVKYKNILIKEEYLSITSLNYVNRIARRRGFIQVTPIYLPR